MSRLEVPLLSRKLLATGDVLLRGELTLQLKDRNGVWKRRVFLVDSGSEMTTMSAFEARRLDLPIPQVATRGAVHVQTGLEIRSGYLSVRVRGMDAAEYALPCLFLGDPAAAVRSAPAGAFSRRLLGLGGVVDKLRIFFDGTPGPSAPYGFLIVEKI